MAMSLSPLEGGIHKLKAPLEGGLGDDLLHNEIVMYYAYVLQSDKFNRSYKGCCSDLEIRLKAHNTGKTKSTKPFRPWRLVYWEEFETFAEARERERYFKTAAGRRFIINKIGPVPARLRQSGGVQWISSYTLRWFILYMY